MKCRYQMEEAGCETPLYSLSRLKVQHLLTPGGPLRVPADMWGTRLLAFLSQDVYSVPDIVKACEYEPQSESSRTTIMSLPTA